MHQSYPWHAQLGRGRALLRAATPCASGRPTPWTRAYVPRRSVHSRAWLQTAALCTSARLAQSAERKALDLVVVGSSPTVGVCKPSRRSVLKTKAKKMQLKGMPPSKVHRQGLLRHGNPLSLAGPCCAMAPSPFRPRRFLVGGRQLRLSAPLALAAAASTEACPPCPWSLAELANFRFCSLEQALKPA